MLTALLIVALLLGPPREPPRAALSVSPHFMQIHEASSKGVRVTVTIPPDDRNRAACVMWESEAELGTHCWEYNELPQVTTTQIYVRLHSLGIYNFVLVLQGTDKRIQTPIQEVEVN